MIKNLPADAGDMGSIPGSGRFPGGGNGNPIQYSCLGNPKDRGAWWNIVHGVAELDTTELLSMHARKDRIYRQMGCQAWHMKLHTEA